jgi:hypothetical protein
MGSWLQLAPNKMTLTGWLMMFLLQRLSIDQNPIGNLTFLILDIHKHPIFLRAIPSMIL